MPHYVYAFPSVDASSLGVTLAGFSPTLGLELLPPTANKRFPVVVGRYIVKWRLSHLAAVLAHELLGHGMQHRRDRLDSLNQRDRECEAFLYQELGHQDLGLDKHRQELVVFRQGLEWHWCAPFKQYMAQHTPADLALWETLNPDVPKLLAVFERYLDEGGVR